VGSFQRSERTNSNPPRSKFIERKLSVGVARQGSFGADVIGRIEIARRKAIRRPLDQERPAARGVAWKLLARVRMWHAKGEQEYSARLEMLDPRGCRRRDAEVHVDAVDILGQRATAIAADYRHVAPWREIPTRALGQMRIEFDRGDASVRSRELRQHGCVVAGACADLRDVLARFDREVIEHLGVQRRAAVVHAALGRKRKHHILIDADRVVYRQGSAGWPLHDPPRRGP
jgi:hypothetical protein